MSDQNQWPKPGDQQPDGQGQNASAPAPGSAAEPNGYGQDTPQQPNPYAPPEQPQYGGSQQPEYGGAQQPQYGAPQAPQYGAPQQADPYGAPQQHDPYGASAPQQPQYGAPRNPYAASGQPQYGGPQQPSNPYAASAPGSAPYGGQGAPGSAPYANDPYAAGAYSNAGYQPYAQRPKTSILAVLSIVFGLGAIPFFFIAILLGPAGAILGHVALGKIKHNGEQGRGLALTGIIAGWVMTGVWILWIAVVVFAIGHSGSGYSGDYDYGTSGAFVS